MKKGQEQLRVLMGGRNGPVAAMAAAAVAMATARWAR